MSETAATRLREAYPNLTDRFIQDRIINIHPGTAGGPCGCCGALYGYAEFPMGIAISVDETPRHAEPYVPEPYVRYSVTQHTYPLGEGKHLNMRMTHVVDHRAPIYERGYNSRKDERLDYCTNEGVNFVYISGYYHLRTYGQSMFTGNMLKGQGVYGGDTYLYAKGEERLAIIKLLEDYWKEKYKGQYLGFILTDDQLPCIKPWLEEMGWTNVLFESPKFNNRNSDAPEDYLTFFLIKG
jgi:hypothetical protein